MQDPAAAVVELEQSVSDLGLLGAYVGTDLGRPLDDPAFDELYAACVALDVPLFLHPAPGGIDAPRRDDRLARFDADLWLGFAHDEALAVATLVLGGVLDRHPELDVCISHGGGSTSWLVERLRHAAATRPWSTPELREPGAVDALLGRLWWDAHVGGPAALGTLVATFGTGRLVGGTNLAGWDETADPSFGDAALASDARRERPTPGATRPLSWRSILRHRAGRAGRSVRGEPVGVEPEREPRRQLHPGDRARLRRRGRRARTARCDPPLRRTRR